MCGMTDGQKSKAMDVFCGRSSLGGYRSCDRRGIRRGMHRRSSAPGRRRPAARSIGPSHRRNSAASSSRRSSRRLSIAGFARGGSRRSVSASRATSRVDRARRAAAAIASDGAAEENCARRVSRGWRARVGGDDSGDRRGADARRVRCAGSYKTAGYDPFALTALGIIVERADA